MTGAIIYYHRLMLIWNNKQHNILVILATINNEGLKRGLTGNGSKSYWINPQIWRDPKYYIFKQLRNVI